MIAATVEELTPMIGTRPACRALGASPATIYRRRRPPAAQAGPAAADARAGADRARAPAGARRAALASGSSTSRRRRPTRRCWTRAPTCARPGRCTGSSPPTTAGSASGAISSPTRRTRRPSCSPSDPNELWSWDVRKLKGPAKWTYFYLYVILDVFSRYVVGWTVQYRETAQLATALIEQADRAAADHPQDPDAARRSRRADARQAGGVPAGRSRRHEDAQSPVHLQRQPLLGVELQDPEVPARVPRPVRLDRARPRALPRVRRLVQPRAPPLRDRADDPGRRPPRPGARSCTPPASTCSTPPTSGTPNGSSASRPPRPSYRPPRGSTSRRRSPPLTKFEREASHRA